MFKLQFKLGNSVHYRNLDSGVINAIARGLPHDGSPYRKGQNPTSVLIRLMNGAVLAVQWVSQPEPFEVTLIQG